jgi:hypothetical protein
MLVRLSGKILREFKECGRRGGQRRALNLTPEKRSTLASQAALARWKKRTKLLPVSIRLLSTSLSDPTYLSEILEYGSIASWRELFNTVSNKPYGEEAMALKRVLASIKIYGVVSLWKRILLTIGIVS